MAKKFKNPNNDEVKTADQWAAEFGYKGAVTFRAYLNKCIRQNRPGDAFVSRAARAARGLNNLANKEQIYVRPDGESKTAKQWAAHIGISKSGWLGRLRKYGASDPRTYETRAEARARRNKAISKARTGQKQKVYARRRVGLAKISVGTWEAKNIPDRWAHLDGQP